MNELSTIEHPAVADRRDGPTFLGWLASAWAWAFLAALLIFFEIWAQFAYGRSFLANGYNLQAIGTAVVAPLLLGLGQTFVIISGGIDLSVGFTMGLAAVVSALVAEAVGPSLGLGVGMALGVVAAVAACALTGLVNGVLIARLKVPPFIGTLGMYGVARGVGYLVSGGGTRVPVSNAYMNWLGNGKIAAVPVVVIFTIIVFLVMHYVLSQTKFGQYTYAIGGNRAAAVRAGVKVRRHTMMIYVLAGVLAAFAGILYSSRFSAGSPIAGEPILLNSIAAVVIGGASLFGGSGTIIGTVIGACIIAVIEYGLVFVNLPAFWQFVAVGLVIIVSVLIDQSRAKLTGDANVVEEG